MAETRSAPTTPPAAGWPFAAAGIAAAAAVLHLAFVGRYGYFRDELYYLACGRRLDWGYVDHPPFVALVARLAHVLFGDSLLAIRILPILAGSLTILLTGLLARELGGGRHAEALAALCAAVAPHYLFVFHILSMNAFEVLLWTAAALVAARLLNGGDPRLWLLFGALCGTGLENKHSMAFFGAGIFVGLLLGRRWEALRSPWLWLGGLLAGLLFLPNLLWEVRHGWPTLEFARNAQAVKIVALTPVQFIGQQVMLLHPITAPVWIAGLGFLLLAPAGRRWRPLGWAYLVVLGVFLAQTAKAYYLTPYATILFAAGAVAAGRLAARRGWGWLPAASLALVGVGGALAAPLVVPILPEESFIRYSAALGVQPGNGERHRMGVLPQHFADMHGWPELTAAVARVYDALPPAERARCGIFGQNYGEAGAIDLLGKAYGLPDALSAHNNYFLWGPRGYGGECLIVLNDDAATLGKIFGDVRQVGLVTCRYCMPYESDLPIQLCRRPKVPLAQLWPRIKKYG